VNLEHSEKILAEFKKNNVPTDLIVMKGAGHGFRGEDATKATAALVAWFDKYLGAR
jgi:dipeptidyl aminopeptidase/acylaminoacyl peptidase